MPDPSNPGDRAKAYRLRKRGKKEALANVDQLWLSEYDEKFEKRQHANGTSKNFGASRSARTIKLDIDEQAESMGTGTAAAVAAGAALAAKEEGRRLDSLTINAVDALKEACGVYKDICLSMRERLEVLEGTHIAMLDSVRDHFIARTQTEAVLLQHQQEEKEDPATALLVQMIANRFGVSLPGATPRPRPPAPPKKGP
jgi:hypothetical protein